MLQGRQAEIEREMFHRALLILGGIVAVVLLCMVN